MSDVEPHDRIDCHFAWCNATSTRRPPFNLGWRNNCAPLKQFCVECSLKQATRKRQHRRNTWQMGSCGDTVVTHWRNCKCSCAEVRSQIINQARNLLAIVCVRPEALCQCH